MKNIVNVFPQIILNKVDYEHTPLPKYWNLSSTHENDINKIIKDYYAKLRIFYDDASITAVLQTINSSCKYLLMLALGTPTLTDISYKESKTYTIFDKRTSLLLYENYLSQIPPNQILLIDPIIIPSNKILSLAGIVGPMIGYTSVDFDSELERKHWYHYRPQETLQELLDIITVVRKELESGIALPPLTDLSIYKSKYDEVADRISGILIYNGIKSNTMNSKEIDMVNSHIHVMTRLQGRNNITDNDISIQKMIFNQIIEKTNKTKK